MERIMENAKSFDYKGLKIYIWHDNEPFNPRQWDNLGKMVCFHNRYNLGDKHEFRDPEHFEEFLLEEKDNIFYLPLYLYDHGGITMKTSPFNCGWDSGQVGYIYITKKRAEEEGLKDPYKTLEHEVKEYDHSLVGNCYGYTIVDEKNNILDSVGGFMGYEDFAIEEAKTNADYWEKTLPKQYALALA
jgi:hypothetical protein